MQCLPMHRFALLACLTLAISNASASDRPNFVLMIADDMGATDCGAMGNQHIRTPNIDTLAVDGIRFTQAFLTCSSCSPSRSSLITCRYPHNTDAEQLHWPLPEDQETFVNLLRLKGYYTAAVGKWHLGPHVMHHFDDVFIAGKRHPNLMQTAASTRAFELENSSSPAIIDQGNASGCRDWVAALETRPSDKPFFFWLAAVDPHRDYRSPTLNEPHVASDVVVPDMLPDQTEVREDLAQYYDEIGRLDFYVGQVVKELDRQGVLDETVIIFMSDNGRPFPRCKTTVFDSGIQTPLFIRYPKVINPGAECAALVSSIDIGPTILELANIDLSQSMMGESFFKCLQDPTQPHREFVFAEHNWHDYDAYQRAVRSRRYKYIRNFDQNLTLSPPADAVRSPTFSVMQSLQRNGELAKSLQQCFEIPRADEEFYDLLQDPFELQNLAGVPEFQLELERHRMELEAWRTETQDQELTVRSPDEFSRETGEALPNIAKPRPSKAELRSRNR